MVTIYGKKNILLQLRDCYRDISLQQFLQKSQTTGVRDVVLELENTIYVWPDQPFFQIAVT